MTVFQELEWIEAASLIMCLRQKAITAEKLSEYLNARNVSQLQEILRKRGSSTLLSAFNINTHDMAVAKGKISRARDKGLCVTTIADEVYPKALLRISDPPFVIYSQGDIGRLNDVPCVSIVGSRKADPVACEFAADLGRELASLGVCVVSGLALGIDGASHQGALEAKVSGSTCAVLGNGLPKIYPSRHATLGARIIDNEGVVLSQFDPITPAYPANFLNRNRLIAGLSRATVVIQAGARSGSLVTARYAAEAGREVLVTPGEIYSDRYAGSHSLLRQGAVLVSGVDDVLEELGIERKEFSPQEDAQSAKHHEILKSLRIREPIEIDSLKYSVESVGNFEMSLLELELEGVVRMLPGGRIERVR